MAQKEIIRTNLVAQNNWDQYAPIYLVREQGNPQGWVVVLENTSGRWYFKTLNKSFRRRELNYLYIDYGQDWRWTNFEEVMVALNHLVSIVDSVELAK